MSWARFSGIRVPWGNYSHRGGKVFMARIRIPGGTLEAAQLKALAYCAKQYGSGLLHITTRQDIQIHQVSAENIIRIHQYLKDYQLSSRGGGGNTIRNITACPLSGVCRDEQFDVRSDAVSLSEYLLSQETSYNLPRKLKISFSGCGLDCYASLVNDIGLVAATDGARTGYRIYAGGGMGSKSALGRRLEEFVSRKDAAYSILAIKSVFYKYGDRKNKHHNRLRFLIEDIGFDKFREHYKKELDSVRETEYVSLREISPVYPEAAQGSRVKPAAQDNGFQHFLKYSCYEQKQQGFTLVKLRVPQGDLKAGQAQAIASLSDEFAGIEFRTSQEQDLYVANVTDKDLQKFYLKVKVILEDFLYPSTLQDVVACKGSVTCNLGLCNSPALAREIEAVIKKDFLGSRIFDKISIKINGCPNACGQHPIGIVSFHGAVRKVADRPAPFYRLLLGARPGIENASLAKDTGILIPAKNVPSFLRDFLEQAEQRISPDTDIHKFMQEEGLLLANSVAEKYSFIPPYSENRDYYIDWGRSEEFSLEGIGPGECGAGILDMIESDLTEARIALDEAIKQGFAVALIRKALFLSSRALLVVKGKDPKTGEEAAAEFIKDFVDEGLASSTYADLARVVDTTRQGLKPQEAGDTFKYAEALLGHINQLYKSMDSSFNFPQQKEAKVTASRNFLDLKGTPCPINYVKAKLFIENIGPGETLEVLLDEGEPIDNVPKSLEGDGHAIVSVEKQDGFYRVVVKKKE